MNFSTWDQIEALVDNQVPETDSLDFKEERPEGVKIAKTIASLTVRGGTIVIGIKEDSSSRAESIEKVSLKSQEEALRQLADTNITPTPAFDVRYLFEEGDEENGIVVVDVPPSALAPHQVGGQFPVRHGSTTRPLLESEVFDLYKSRRLSAQTETGQVPQVDHLFPRLLTDGEFGGSIMGVASFTITARMRGGLSHPGEPYLVADLLKTNTAASTWINSQSLNCRFSYDLAENAGRAEKNTDGILVVGGNVADAETRVRTDLALQFPATLSLRVTVPLRYSEDGIQELNGNTVHEDRLVQETYGFLHFAGQWFSAYPSQGLVDVYIEAAGFKEAKAFISAVPPRLEPTQWDELPSASSSFSNSGSDWAQTLVADPVPLAQELLYRWFFSFIHDEVQAQRAFRVTH